MNAPPAESLAQSAGLRQCVSPQTGLDLQLEITPPLRRTTLELTRQRLDAGCCHRDLSLLREDLKLQEVAEALHMVDRSVDLGALPENAGGMPPLDDFGEHPEAEG